MPSVRGNTRSSASAIEGKDGRQHDNARRRDHRQGKYKLSLAKGTAGLHGEGWWSITVSEENAIFSLALNRRWTAQDESNFNPVNERPMEVSLIYSGMSSDEIGSPESGSDRGSEPLASADLMSSMPKIGIDLYGFATEELANKVGEAVYCYLHEIGKILNLARLVRVIVSYDYQGALAGLERGVATSKPLTATNDEIAIGIAMAPTILVEGEPRAAIVLNAAYMSVLAQPETPELTPICDEMVYTLAHESGHVHDLDMKAKCLPGIILHTQLDFRNGVLFRIASGCWEEYIACRLSSFMGKEPTLRAYEDTFCSSLNGVKKRADACIRQYRMHADVPRVTEEVSEEYRRVMVYASYLIGHLDGLERTPADDAPKAMEAVKQNDYFKPFFTGLQIELRAMYAVYGEWQSLDVFEPLKQLAERLLRFGGLDIQPASDGSAHISVPFRAETIPTVEEQRAFLTAKKAGAKE